MEPQSAYRGRRMRHWIALALLVFGVSFSASAQEASEKDDGTGREEEGERDKIKFDFSFDYDPEELREHWRELVRWKRIWGPIGVEMHIFPAAEGGPYYGPPTRIWTNGVGTSLWRDPVTGWALQ